MTTVWVVSAKGVGADSWGLLGAYASEAEAREAGAVWAAERADLAHYDPARRREAVAPGRWADAWVRRTGAPEVRVEALGLGAAPGPPSGREPGLVLSLDAALKELAASGGGAGGAAAAPTRDDAALAARGAFSRGERAREWRAA